MDLPQLIKAKEKELLLVDPRNGGGARMHALNKELQTLKAALRGDEAALAQVQPLIEADAERQRRGAILRDTLRPVEPGERPKFKVPQ